MLGFTLQQAGSTIPSWYHTYMAICESAHTVLLTVIDILD